MLEEEIMIKKIDWADIPNPTNKDVEMESISSNEMGIRQTVATSNEISLQKQIETTCDNEFDKSIIATIESRFSPTFMTTANYESHSFAEIFPDATESEFNSLLADMEVHEQFEPIIIFEGKIADGRTRKKVQDTLKRQTLAHEWIGEPQELLNYLYAKSQHRNLNSQQRAVISLQFVQAERDLAKGRQGMRTDLNKILNAVKGRALEKVAKKHGTNRTYLSHAEMIKDKAEELLNYVKRNEIPITQAKLLAEKIADREQRLEAMAEYKKGKRTMNVIIDEIKFKKGTAHDISDSKKDSKDVEIDSIPALILFQSLKFWENQEKAKEKMKQATEILGIDTKQIWYIPDVNEKDSKAILNLIKSLVKKLKMIRRFSADGQELNNNC